MGCVGTTSGSAGRATVDIAPPVFSARPDLLLIDAAPDIYYVKGYPIFFYLDLWYYYSNDKWFYSSSYNGPWVYVETHRLPPRLGHIPPGHIRTPPGHTKPQTTPPGHTKKEPPGQKKKGR